MSKQKEYHFSCGNSATGPVGMCAVVRATSKEEAAELLTELMPESVDVEIDHPAVVYCQVYLGTAKARHVDEIEEATE